MSINKWRNKQAAAYPYNRILFARKRKKELITCNRDESQILMLSERSRNKKSQKREKEKEKSVFLKNKMGGNTRYHSRLFTINSNSSTIHKESDKTERLSLSTLNKKWKSRTWFLTAVKHSRIYFFAVKLLSHIQLFATPWTAAHQAPQSSTISQSLLTFKAIKSRV